MTRKTHRIQLLLFCLLFQYSCFPSFESKEFDRLYLKEIRNSKIKIDWFYYSTISGTTPDYILIYKESNIDTVCVADNIKEVTIENGEVKIAFYGYPMKYGMRTHVQDSIFKTRIKIDTSYVFDAPQHRSTYKKNHHAGASL
jgi:hypothetical protein